jgi:hypothetical protein
MSFGHDGRELNGDQQDRRPQHPQQCAGRHHRRILTWGRCRGNNGRKCGKCMVAAMINDPTGR